MKDLAAIHHELAVMFLSHFIDQPTEEIEQMEITVALSGLIAQVVNETEKVVNQEKKVLH